MMEFHKIELNNNDGTICINFWGDFVWKEKQHILFKDGKLNEILSDELVNNIHKSDCNVINLEAPVTECTKSIFKPGAPCLKSPAEAVRFLKSFPNLVLSGANNHIYDYGENGIFDTLNFASEENIRTVGFGKNMTEAKIPIVICCNENKIGILSYAQHEFSIAENDQAGANPYDPLEVFDEIKWMKQNCDAVIVLFHIGCEHYQYPTPNMQKICRKMVLCGADLILCQHSHCIGSREIFDNGEILYGQGNFIFDWLDLPCWESGFLVRVTFDKKLKIEYIPMKYEKNGTKRLMTAEEKKEALEVFEKRSNVCRYPEKVSCEWEKFCLDPYKYSSFITGSILGFHNRYILAIDRRLHNILANWILKNPARRLLLWNFFSCESITEMMKTILHDSPKKKQE